MYRIIPLRVLRRTKGVKFDEMVPSDIPKISGIDRVIHGANSISPAPVACSSEHDNDVPVKRPWYMHPGQDDNLLVLQGTRYIDIFDPKTLTKASFIVNPDRVYKNDKLYYDGPAMVVWPAGIFHRIISGVEGSISVNFATRNPEKFKIEDNFNIYRLCTITGKYDLLKEGHEDQPVLDYVYPNEDIKLLFKT